MFYVPDDKDAVHLEPVAPTPLGGAPCPSVLASEHLLLLCYVCDIQSRRPSHSEPLGLDVAVYDFAIIELRPPRTYFSLPLGDETRYAHPLICRGPDPLDSGVVRIENSSLIRRLISAQYVHQRPFPQAYDKSKHWVFAFKDSMFEVVADEMRIHQITGPFGVARSEMRRIFGEHRPDHP